MEIKEITHQDIAYHDKRYFIPGHGESAMLEQSIRNSGLISPPIVTTRADGYVVVCGWKRLRIIRAMGQAGFSALVEENQDDGSLFRKAVEENSIVRPFSELEKAWVLAKFKGFGIEEENLIREICPLLGLPAAKWSLEAYLSFHDLEPEVQSVVKDKNLSRQALLALTELSDEGRAAVQPLLSPLGGNKIRELCEDLNEVTRRKRINATEVMNEPEIQELLKSSQLSLQQKAEKMRYLIKTYRYPQYYSWKQRMEEILQKVDWPEDMDFVPTAYFEDQDISVTIKFSGIEDMKAKLKTLTGISESKDFAELIGFLSND